MKFNTFSVWFVDGATITFKKETDKKDIDLYAEEMIEAYPEKKEQIEADVAAGEVYWLNIDDQEYAWYSPARVDGSKEKLFKMIVEDINESIGCATNADYEELWAAVHNVSI